MIKLKVVEFVDTMHCLGQVRKGRISAATPGLEKIQMWMEDDKVYFSVPGRPLEFCPFVRCGVCEQANEAADTGDAVPPATLAEVDKAFRGGFTKEHIEAVENSDNATLKLFDKVLGTAKEAIDVLLCKGCGQPFQREHYAQKYCRGCRPSK